MTLARVKPAFRVALTGAVIGSVLYVGGSWVLRETHFLLRDDYLAGREIGQNHEPYSKPQMWTLCREQMDRRYGVDASYSDARAAFELGCHDVINGIEKDFGRLDSHLPD